MSPNLITGFFLFLGLYSAWGLLNTLRTGVVIGRNSKSTVDVRENPGGFYLLVFFNAAFICFATAVVLYAFGLIGDPFVWMQHYFPCLMPS
jgi:hypothetical protein